MSSWSGSIVGHLIVMSVPNAANRCLHDESIPAARKRLHITRVRPGVRQGRAQLFDTGVQTIVELDEYAVWPQCAPELLAGDDFAWMLKQIFEHHGRLWPQPYSAGSISELAAACVEYEFSKRV